MVEKDLKTEKIKYNIGDAQLHYVTKSEKGRKLKVIVDIVDAEHMITTKFYPPDDMRIRIAESHRMIGRFSGTPTVITLKEGMTPKRMKAILNHWAYKIVSFVGWGLKTLSFINSLRMKNLRRE